MKITAMKTSLLWPALAALALSGCSVGHTEYSRTAMQHVDMSVTGIPTVLGLGILGTTIPLTPEYSRSEKRRSTREGLSPLLRRRDYLS